MDANGVSKKDYSRLFWGIILGGTVLPWLIGIWVWFDLQRQGKPVQMIDQYFGTPSAALLAVGLMAIMTGIFSLAPITTAYITRILLAHYASGFEALELRGVVAAWGGLLGGVVWTVYMYVNIWETIGDYIMIMVFAPFFPLIGRP